jgi:membrane protease subunit HflK
VAEPRQPDSHQGDDVPIEDRPMEVETPRRAASAQLVVESEVGADAQLREAMDPANQSLADALRLSYRFLQFVILALLALFLVSGFQRVDDSQSGVMLRFGRIVEVDDQMALEPGLRRNLLPYPAGEFVIFDVEGRSVDIATTFFPRLPANLSLDQAIERASPRGTLRVGQVGYVLTDGGDIAHLKAAATYNISDPVRLVETLNVDDVDRTVKLALDRAIVASSAGLMLQDIIEQPEVVRDLIRTNAQDLLDTIDCGIRITDVQLLDAKPPFAIVKVYRELQNAREESRRAIVNAGQEATETLIETAGADWRVLAELINRYQREEDLGNTVRGTELLGEINTLLESDAISGAVSDMIHRADAYESEIELTLGREAQRFRDLLPSYRAQPYLVSKRQWLEAVSFVFARKDVEVIRVPAGLGSVDIGISGSQEIAKIRREELLKRRQRQGMNKALSGYNRYLQRTEDWDLDTSNPLLEIGPDGKIRPKGARR